MSKTTALIARIEEQAVALHQAEQRNTDAFAAHDRANERVQALARERDALQARINTLVEESREARARIASMEHARKNTPRLSQAVTDAASLIDRGDLTDAEKLRSISGLLDQVLPDRKHAIPFFVQAADTVAAAPKVPRKRPSRRTPPPNPHQMMAGHGDDGSIPWQSPDTEIEAEPETDEDAREFARDY